MWKNLWFQTHWLLGITAGVVLAVVGLTGGLLSFESDILRWLNPDVMTVAAQPEAPLPAAERLRIAQSAMPDKKIIGLTIEADPTLAGQVGFAGGRRGEWIYQNPYTGELLGKPSVGEDFLHLMEDIHRRLAAGDVGKQIVGASTVILLVLAFTGLYLRWPRQVGSWRAWLTFSFARKGRSFLWDMHSVIGTWVLPLYLLAALTGLYWSYDWYRDGLFELTGAPRPTPPQGQMAPGAGPGNAGANNTANRGPANAAGTGENRKPAAEAGARSDRRRPEAEPDQPAKPAFSDATVTRLWQSFEQELSQPYQRATLRLPERNGQPVEFRYLDADPAHDRANNTISFAVDTFSVVKHERYDQLPAGSKLMRSMFALHSGGFFGLTGLLLMMVASLLMPLFAITGWMLYLDRRGKKRAAKRAAASLQTQTASAAEAPEPLLIAYASQTGYAEQLAWQSAGLLQAAGLPVQVRSIASVDGAALSGFRQALFVVSTFGDGEAPDAARGFAKRVLHDTPSLNHLRYAVLALGDRQYQTFCGFGRAIDQWLRRHGANAMFAPVEVDKADPQALATWQQHLQTLSGSSANVNWGEQQFQTWQLIERRQLNNGSAGAPMFHLALKPAAQTPTPQWQAGDLFDVLPQQSAETVRTMRYGLGLAADAQINSEPVEQWLSRQECPTPDQLALWRQLPLTELVNKMQALQPRTYSLASIPADGSVQLLVRQERHPDGSLGVGSGWLTAELPLAAMVSAVLRSNPGFHAEHYQQPMILIGNGSGLSALRAHLRAAELSGSRGHWLIFGERSRVTDFLYQTEVERWQANGVLAELDLAFSRDQAERVYVQHRLRESAERLRRWVDAGAVLYVCGSAQGMASGVEQVLVETLGAERVAELIEQGRYRRDVY